MPEAPHHSAQPHGGHGDAAGRAVDDHRTLLPAIMRRTQAENLRTLRQHGVTIAIGSDHATTSVAEALHLHTLQVFDNLTLLKMWCETTPRTIFPRRNIGSLADGHEARFLVLQGNPIERFEETTRFTMRFKQGHPLLLPND